MQLNRVMMKTKDGNNIHVSCAILRKAKQKALNALFEEKILFEKKKGGVLLQVMRADHGSRHKFSIFI